MRRNCRRIIGITWGVCLPKLACLFDFPQPLQGARPDDHQRPLGLSCLFYCYYLPRLYEAGRRGYSGLTCRPAGLEPTMSSQKTRLGLSFLGQTGTSPCCPETHRE